MKYVLTIVSREILTAEEEGLGTTGTRKGVNQPPGEKTEVSWMFLNTTSSLSRLGVRTLFTPGLEFLTALWLLARIETKMHLDRGHRSRGSCSSATIRINPVILQNRIQEPCTKCSWHDTLVSVPALDTDMTLWHHHKSRVRHHYLIILYPSLSTSHQS